MKLVCFKITEQFIMASIKKNSCSEATKPKCDINLMFKKLENEYKNQLNFNFDIRNSSFCLS